MKVSFLPSRIKSGSREFFGGTGSQTLPMEAKIMLA